MPEASYIGIVIAALSLIVMPLYAGQNAALPDNLTAVQCWQRETDICAYLSAILLGGLILNALLGWWWADPLAALIMIPIIVKEGIEGLRGKTCCNDGGCH